MIYGFFGVEVAYMIVVFFVMIALSLLFTVKRYPTPHVELTETIWRRLSTGLRFVFKNQILLGTMSLDMLAQRTFTSPFFCSS